MSTGILNLTNNLRNYLWEKGMQEHPVLAELREETAQIPESVMQICPEQGALMANLIRLMSAKKTIEIGTFTGLSTLSMSLGLSNDGILTAIDKNAETNLKAKSFFKKANQAKKIKTIVKPALEALEELKIIDSKFDIIFIDADKDNYKNYYNNVMEMTKTGGLIIIDNVLWHGEVADEDNKDKLTKIIRDFNDYVKNDKRTEQIIVPIGDGFTICSKL